MRDIKHFINGRFVGTDGGKCFDNVAPATGELIGRVHEAGRREVGQAVSAARDALRGEWGSMTLNERCSLLDRPAARATPVLMSSSRRSARIRGSHTHSPVKSTSRGGRPISRFSPTP